MRRALQDRRAWLGGGLAVTVVLLALSWVLVISPQRGTAEQLREQTAAAQTTNAGLRATVRTLQRRSQDRAALTGELATALDQLPDDPALASFGQQLSDQAGRTGVSLTALTISDPASAAASGTAASGSTPTTATGAGGGQSATGLMRIPITVVAAGDGPKLLAFLHAVQVDGPRRVLVGGVSLAPVAQTATASLDTGAKMTVQLAAYFTAVPQAERAYLEHLLQGDLSR